MSLKDTMRELEEVISELDDHSAIHSVEVSSGSIFRWRDNLMRVEEELRRYERPAYIAARADHPDGKQYAYFVVFLEPPNSGHPLPAWVVEEWRPELAEMRKVIAVGHESEASAAAIYEAIGLEERWKEQERVRTGEGAQAGARRAF